MTDQDYRTTVPYEDNGLGFGAVAPPRSALTLRLALAIFGLMFCTGAAIGAAIAGIPSATVVLAVLALIAIADIGVILRRKRRGEPA